LAKQNKNNFCTFPILIVEKFVFYEVIALAAAVFITSYSQEAALFCGLKTMYLLRR